MLSCFPSDLSAVERQRPRGKMERRALGKSGLKLSMLGFGGFALNGRTPEQARELVQEAYEAGVNLFDVSPSYGHAQERMGPRWSRFGNGRSWPAKLASARSTRPPRNWIARSNSSKPIILTSTNYTQSQS